MYAWALGIHELLTTSQAYYVDGPFPLILNQRDHLHAWEQVNVHEEIPNGALEKKSIPVADVYFLSDVRHRLFFSLRKCPCESRVS